MSQWVGGVPGGPNLDPETYLRAIDTKDFLRLVITGHLYIEAVLIQLIKKRAPQNAAGVEDLRFMALVDRAIASGLVLADERESYRRLSGMRNKLAHELGHRYDGRRRGLPEEPIAAAAQSGVGTDLASGCLGHRSAARPSGPMRRLHSRLSAA